MIQTKGLFKHYGQTAVVNDVSLQLPTGRLIAFIGSNGAGKSTLISLISRTLARDQGQILIDQQALEQWKSQKLATRLSILKQSNELSLRLTVRELTGFGRYPYSRGRLTPQDEEKIDQALAYLHLEALQDRYLDQLSGGQRQLAYIAMLLAQDTEYVFLDEPLNNLDMKHSVQIMQVLRRMVSEMGKTVMVVIHDINFVAAYSDYIIALKDGQIAFQGETAQVITPQRLKAIFDLDIEVHEINGHPICVYYN
ncbi:MAG: ATP-binding cassette domain-containing protein [Oscillospiraceae bacterium]|nr:ATP-binding cassette domain-containing protein [Oscillospiraceae bacterium]MDD4368975.1 ATP-binding cassette domain-containing protein [Oscillospiraceae bacterium]